MKATLPSAVELSLEELRSLRQLTLAVDDLFEQSLRARENLEQTFRRALPALLELTGASGAVVTTLSEELIEETWAHGAFGGEPPQALLRRHPWGVHRVGAGTFVSQALDVVGMKVGSMGLFFDEDHTAPARAQRLSRVLETIAEKIETVIAKVQTASEKHQLIMTLTTLLSHRVFEVAMDQTVQALADRVKVPGFLVLYKDAVDSAALHYRVYEHGRLTHASGVTPHPALEKVIAERGNSLLGASSKSNQGLGALLGAKREIEAVLIAGGGGSETLGKILVWSPDTGFSAFTMDVIRVLASTLSQRLIDYNRERIHLSQFFSARDIDALLHEPNYESRYLTPRDEEVGILFADINGFTRICEQVLERPEKIGQFVDDWSKEAVNILWKHGGVFDKMVGDCVIGLFGPPFFRTTRVERAAAAVRAACEIQAFTRDVMSSHPEVARLSELISLPGLGVAIGVNLANAYCGLFGPNRQYTGFSTGMNQTARLQALGAFRETLVMESVREALKDSDDPFCRALTYGPLTETPVKNVEKPLRHFSLVLPAANDA